MLKCADCKRVVLAVHVFEAWWLKGRRLRWQLCAEPCWVEEAKEAFELAQHVGGAGITVENARTA